MKNLIPSMIESVDLNHHDWTDQTDGLIVSVAKAHPGENLAELIAQNMTLNTDLDKLEVIFEIILNGYPGIDSRAVGNSLREWTWSDDEI